MKDLKTIDHNCYKCGASRKITAQSSSKSYETYIKNENGYPATFLSKNKVEVIYSCKECGNKNKVIIDL